MQTPIKIVTELPKKTLLEELGDIGIQEYFGLIMQAYYKQLRYPTCQVDYERLRTSDPEISMVRLFFVALSGSIGMHWEIPEDGDEKALEFAESVTEEMEGGFQGFLNTVFSQTPFFGWSWFEVVYGLRTPSFTGSNGWKSQYTDGLLGVQKLAFRDTSSFSRWEVGEHAQLLGMWQNDIHKGKEVFIPKSKSVHLVFGDRFNPEGTSPLASVYKTETIKRAYEFIQGMGFEHTAGHLMIKSERTQLSPEDKALVNTAAKNLLSAKQGNYGIFPAGMEAQLIDVPFGAAPSILEAIRFNGLYKLAAYQCQFLGMGTLADTGAYSAMQEGFTIFLTIFNSMAKTFVDQLDEQLGGALFKLNGVRFDETKRPHLVVEPVSREIGLDVLGSFVQSVSSVIRLGDDDERAIRRRSGILPEQIPEDAVYKSPGALITESQLGGACSCGVDHDAELMKLHEGSRGIAIGKDEFPVNLGGRSRITDTDKNRAVREWKKLCIANGRPELQNLLDAEVIRDAD